MASLCWTVPYCRTSVLHIPRRDLVLASTDSIYLRVTVVDSDNPCAQGIELTGGIGGPSIALTVWADQQGWHCDYGLMLPRCGRQVFSAAGVHQADTIGAFDFWLPSGTMSSWPRRCGYALQLGFDERGSEVLATGRIVLRPGIAAPFLFDPPALTTDDDIPIHTDTEEQVLA